MWRAIIPALACMVLAASLFASWPARAECTDDQVLEFHEKGIPAKKIADRCEMDLETVKEIIASAEPEEDPPPQRQAYCCDVFGNSRCPIVSGSTAIGAGCFCPGQGYGTICR